MKYIGNPHRETVTLHLSFVDEPVTALAVHEAPFNVHQLMMQERAAEAIEQVFRHDFAHIILHEAHPTEVQEFFTAWGEASESLQQSEQTADQLIRSLMNGFTNHT